MKVNDFKKIYKINEVNTAIERKKGGEIIITPDLKEIIIKLLKGEIEKKDIKDINDDETIEIILLKIVAEDPTLDELFEKYYNRKRLNFEGYTFRPEAIQMLKKDCSQTYMAEKLEIPRKTFSGIIKNLRKENKDNELGILLREHSERKMKRIELTPEAKVRLNNMLDCYLEKHPVSKEVFENKDPAQARLDNLSKLLATVEEMLQEGFSLKELSEKKIISESNYRKYKTEAKYLGIILSRRNRNGQGNKDNFQGDKNNNEAR